MPCLLLFKDALGRLPTAQELLRFGFRVSAAALPEHTLAHGQEHESEYAQALRRGALACAAEAPAPYGREEEAPGPAALPGHPACKTAPEAGRREEDAA
ncbi:hypothetical protein JCM14124_00550 [Humidesulfovibrio idahonensis]